MKVKRIGLAINAQHVHAEDQQIYHGIRDYSREHPEFECVLAPFAADELKTTASVPYHGILAQATPDLVAVATHLGIPVVDVWFDSSVTVPINRVFPDFAKAGRLVGQHLVHRGFDNFGYVINGYAQSQAMMCNAELIHADALGFEAYIKARGFACAHFVAPQNVMEDARTWHRWSSSIRQWIREQPKPLGLFVPSDMLCRHIADLAHELGLNIPHDLGLVSAQNEPNLCLLTEPLLTSVDLGYRRVGYEAAAMLDRMLSDRQLMKKREILLVEPQTLHTRHSTDASNARDPLVASAMRFILDHANEPIGVKDVVKQVAATRRTLERRFRDTLERTVMQEITRCRIERLKRRLSEGPEPIKQLAQNSGFNSVRMLYQTFVREEGMSPSAYRQKRRAVSRPTHKG